MDQEAGQVLPVSMVQSWLEIQPLVSFESCFPVSVQQEPLVPLYHMLVYLHPQLTESPEDTDHLHPCLVFRVVQKD